MKSYSIEWGSHRLDLGNTTRIMGIVNVTPDSFSDGGLFFDCNAAVARGEKLAEDGADILDIGGESSRPFSGAVSAEEEIRRVVPVIEKLAERISIPISIDTTKAVVARKAIEAGASMINDISALRSDAELAGVAVNYDLPVILMHMKGTPENMQVSPHYDDLLGEIKGFLKDAIERAVRRGIDRRKDVVEKTEIFKKQVIGQTFGQEILKTLKVSDNEIEEYYEQHKNEYEQIGISAIFIKTDPENGITKEAALAEAEEASERAKAGEDWKELVKRFSDGVPGKKAGKAEYIERGKFGAEIDERLFPMEKGEITNPLEVDGGYYIIRIEDGARHPPHGQIKRKIESRLINEKLIKYVYGLRDELGVEVYRDRLEESVHSE